MISVVAFHAGGHSGERDVRAALLAAAVTWGVVVTAITELLSLVGLLTFGGLVTAWPGGRVSPSLRCHGARSPGGTWLGSRPGPSLLPA